MSASFNSPAPEGFLLTCFELDATVFLAASSRFSSILPFHRLPEARSDVCPLFDCFYFMPKLFYFEINFSRTRFLAFFKRLLLFDVPLNEQILDIRYPGAFFRGQAIVSFHLNSLPRSASAVPRWQHRRKQSSSAALASVTKELLLLK
jgi:hypothetical protein